ncbi:MAG TPA: RsmE family RNA methyltransferase [Dehalococcoidia bacterium]|nr:RsmE family RNA methyltransferase [Dehalococcoidia bacterium]
MNIILFDASETSQLLPMADPRARHILEVLRREPGDSFDAGLIDGPRCRATLVSIDEAGLRMSFVPGEMPAPLMPITLIVGLPRPQTARKLLEEATTLGVEALHFVACERGESSYRQSRLWATDEWRRHVIAGAEQAFSTLLPEVSFDLSLGGAVRALGPGYCKIALDNYEAASALGSMRVEPPVVLALGPERGWSAAERSLLRSHGFEMAHLGERVLRVETACVAALSLVRAQLGLS